LRHYGFDFRLEANDGSAAFAADATFRQVAGLANSSWTSFQSYSHPDRYLRHYAYLLRLDPVTDAQSRADATFRVTS
ncbi:AbfB domain-containing protein, partial [Micromonospora sp. M51]